VLGRVGGGLVEVSLRNGGIGYVEEWVFKPSSSEAYPAPERQSQPSDDRGAPPQPNRPESAPSTSWRVVQPARPHVRLASLITANDYPASALRNGDEGATAFRLEINRDGAVARCIITGSSGSSALDDATCQVMSRRARFSPARDASGSAIEGSHDSLVVWRLQ
jgi:periplasmic protein TonB